MARWWIAVMIALGGATPAVAQDATRETKDVEPVVVTATKIETSADRLGAAVSVITEDELRTYNHSRIEDALRTVPGVEIIRQGSLGKTTGISIRGANGNQVQVLVDGMRVKDITLGAFDFSNLSLDGIERIEVVRGPQSTLYGADAIGGVVNIITKKGSGPPAGAVGFEGGSHQTFREQAAVGGAVGRFNFSLSGSRLDSRGQKREFDNDDSDQTAFAGRLGFDLPWQASITATGRYAKSNTDVPTQGFGAFRGDPDSQQQTEFYLFTLAYEQTVLPWWQVRARMGQMWTSQGFQNGPEPAVDFVFESQVNTTRQEFEVLNTWQTGSINTVTLGLEHRNEFGRSRGSFRAETRTESVFVQDELRPVPGLTVAGGARYEDNDAFGSALTPRVSLAYLVSATGTKLRGGWGEGFRAPTLNDLFFPAGFGCPPFGNPDAKPERSTSWDAGVDQKLWDNRIRLGFTYFHNTFRDLITPVPISAFCVQVGNVGRARTEGVEAAVEADPLDWLHLYTNYTFTDAENEITGKRLFGQARHRWNAGVVVTPHPRLSLFAQSYIASSIYDIADRNVPGFYRIDAGGTLNLLRRAGRLDRLDFTLRIENLTDVQYTQNFGFRALGFTALAGLRAYFR
jgi:vitamin B12 transporter